MAGCGENKNEDLAAVEKLDDKGEEAQIVVEDEKTEEEPVEEIEEETEEQIEGRGDYITNIPFITIETTEEDVKDDDSGYYLANFVSSSIEADSAIEDYSALAQAVKSYSDGAQIKDSDKEEFVNVARELIDVMGPDYISMDYPLTSLSVKFDPARIDSSLVSLARTDYMYQGGAHGQMDYTGVTFDTKSGKKLTADDVFADKKGFLDYFKQICLENIPDIVGDTEMLFEGYEDVIRDVDFSNDNWYFDSTGITYVFQAYELAAYAAGNIHITIDYEQLTPFIEPEYLPTIGDRIAYVGEDGRGTISLHDGLYVDIDNYHNEDYSEYTGSVTIGSDSKRLTDNGYIWGSYIVHRCDEVYLFVNYYTRNPDYCETDTRYDLYNFAVLDITDGNMRVIYEESDAAFVASSLNMDSFDVQLVYADGEELEQRIMSEVLGE